MILQDLFQELEGTILPGSCRPNLNKTILQIEFYRYAPQHFATHVYLVDQEELTSMAFPPRKDALVLFVACANALQPNFDFPENYCPVFVGLPIATLVHKCFVPYYREETRQQILSVFRMGEKAHLPMTGILSAACLPLSIGVCLFQDNGELVMQECADSFFQAYMPDGDQKATFFQVMISNVREALRSGSSPFFKDDLCYEFRTLSIENRATLILVVFYTRKDIFDFDFFAQQFHDYATRQSSFYYSALEQPAPDTALRQILDGTMKDYPAIADILYGADHRMKGFRLLQIQPSDPNISWRQWIAALRAMLRNAFHWVHISHDGVYVTALLIAEYPTPENHTQTKNSVQPLRFYKPGWDQEVLKEMLRQAGANCMLSAATSSLDMIPVLHEQTKLTLDIATKVEPASSVGQFWEHTDYLPYLPIHYGFQKYMEQGISLKATGLWLHPEVFRLLRNDLVEGKDHAQVLYAYLQNGMDVGEVSQMLYMHRNTVYARLKAIEAFTGRNLKDSIFHNSFLPSLRLYYYCRHYLNIGDEHLLLINRMDSFTDAVRADKDPGATSV